MCGERVSAPFAPWIRCLVEIFEVADHWTGPRSEHFLHTIHSTTASSKSNTKPFGAAEAEPLSRWAAQPHRIRCDILSPLSHNCIDYKSLYFSPLATSHLVIIFILHFPRRIDMCECGKLYTVKAWSVPISRPLKMNGKKEKKKRKESHPRLQLTTFRIYFINVWCLIWAANLFNVSNISTK